MRSCFEEFGLYHVDMDYVKYLYNVDSEVYFVNEQQYSRKPFVGILIDLSTHKYFIPLTSSKPVHEKWSLQKQDYIMLCKKVRQQLQGGVYKKIDNDLLQVLALVDIKKMIPVPDGCYELIDIDNEMDLKYRALLQDEVRACRNIKHKILEKAEKLYNKQLNSKRVLPMYCNFAILEENCAKYKKN